MPDSSTHAPVRVRHFACPGCGATLVFAANIDKLRCEHCDSTHEIPKNDSATLGGPVNHALTELFLQQEKKSWGTDTVSFECGDCGASITLPAGQMTGRCPFCDNDVVVQKPPDPNIITPETLIPFKVDKQAAANQFRTWLGGLWFAPNNLKRMADLAEIKGVYTPFWLFDAQASSKWSAESGYHVSDLTGPYLVTETYTDKHGTKRNRQAYKTRWEPSCGEHSAPYNSVLVCASVLPGRYLQALGPFNIQEDLVAYRPEFLSGWMAEEYKVGPKAGWQRGEAYLMYREYHACEKMVPGDEHRNLNVSTRLDKVTWKHILIPVWIAAYRYNGQRYRFMVNGETGKVSGECPLSPFKLTGFLVCIITLFFALVCLVESPQPKWVNNLMLTTLIGVLLIAVRLKQRGRLLGIQRFLDRLAQLRSEREAPGYIVDGGGEHAPAEARNVDGNR